MDTKNHSIELLDLNVIAKCQWSSMFVQSMFNGKPSGYRLGLEVEPDDSVDILLNHGIARVVKGNYKNSRSERDGKVYWSVSNRNPFPVYDSRGINMRTKGGDIRVMDKYFNGSTVSVSLTAKAMANPIFGKRIVLISNSVRMIEKPLVEFELS